MSEIDEQVANEQVGWGSADSLNYYRAHRGQPTDLYESERYFLPDLLPRIGSVLDVGCAAGGFSRIMRSFNPTLEYTGVDITAELIASARRDYPDCRFEISDGIKFPFPAGSFDLVHCSGVLHLNSRYRDMVRSMWEQTRRFLLCDFRLTNEPTQVGEMEIRFAEQGSAAKLPYHVIHVDELLEFLQTLTPRPAALRARGYSHPVSSAASVSLERVIMAFFLLEKGAGSPIVDIDLDGSAMTSLSKS